AAASRVRAARSARVRARTLGETARAVGRLRHLPRVARTSVTAIAAASPDRTRTTGPRPEGVVAHPAAAVRVADPHGVAVLGGPVGDLAIDREAVEDRRLGHDRIGDDRLAVTRRLNAEDRRQVRAR